MLRGVVKKSGDYCKWMKIAFFLCKIRFRTHIFIIWGQTHNQKSHKRLTVRWVVVVVIGVGVGGQRLRSA